MIKADPNMISFSGLSPDIITFKIGELKIQKDLLNAVVDIAQMYDIFQYSNCLKIQYYPEDAPERAKLMLEKRLLEFLTMLRIAQIKPSEEIEKALADWIAVTFSKRIEEESPIIPDKFEGRKQARESPPAKKLDKVKRSIAKAKFETPYLEYALSRPKFDIEKVYELKLSEID